MPQASSDHAAQGQAAVPAELLELGADGVGEALDQVAELRGVVAEHPVEEDLGRAEIGGARPHVGAPSSMRRRALALESPAGVLRGAAKVLEPAYPGRVLASVRSA